jgi:hypothetical protein
LATIVGWYEAMRKSIILLPLLLTGCGTRDSLANKAGPGNAGPPGETVSRPAEAQTATLTGLYESGPADRQSQMCMIDRGTGGTRFGLVLRGEGDRLCAGSGSAVRSGDSVRLTMSGDEPCTVEARIAGTNLVFPASLPVGCAYYCSSGASFAGASFVKTGGSAEDAARATDLVGDRLCAG